MMMMVLDDGDDNDGNCYDDGKFNNVIYASCIIYNPMSECIHLEMFSMMIMMQ